MLAEWPPYVAHAFRCPCGTEIGVSGIGVNRSYQDGRELGTAYLALDPEAMSGAVCLWKVHTGDAGHFDQRCPNCDGQLVQAPAQKALFG